MFRAVSDCQKRPVLSGNLDSMSLHQSQHVAESVLIDGGKPLDFQGMDGVVTAGLCPPPGSVRLAWPHIIADPLP